MSWWFWNILTCLLGALLIGLVVGWLLRRFGALEREADLLGELDIRNERVGSLEGQVGERDQRIIGLGADLEQWQAKVPALESTLAERDVQVMGLTTDLDGWKQKLPKLETRLAEAETARTELAADLDTRSRELAARSAAADQVDVELAQLQKLHAANSEKLATETAHFNSELTAQRRQLDELRTERDNDLAVHAALDEQHTGLQSEFAALKGRSDQLTSEATDRESALNELRETLKKQADERTSLAEQLTSMAPVAARVDSQDQSIASLNQDLRARDTTIKSLRDELTAAGAQSQALAEAEQSRTALSVELDGMRTELAGATARVTELTDSRSASDESDRIAAGKAAKDKQAGLEQEWRSRLRIAESGRQQVQTELYRRQEHVERLERQLTERDRRLAQQQAASGAASNSAGGGAAGAGAAAGAALGLLGAAAATPAGRVAATDDREWRSRLRIAESAQRRAEADNQRQLERVSQLERRLRDAQRGERSMKASATQSPGAAKTQAAPKAPAVPPASVAAKAPAAPNARALSTPPASAAASDKATGSNTGSGEQRFLASAPADPDDLKQIKGVGKVLQNTLNSLGIYQFRQVAQFTSEDISWVDDRLKFKGRIERDNWVAQAAELHRAKHGTDPKA